MSGASFYRLTGRLQGIQTNNSAPHQPDKQHHLPRATSTISGRQSLETQQALNPADYLDANDAANSRRPDSTSLDMQDRNLIKPASNAAMEDDRGQSAAWLLHAKSYMYFASFSPASRSGGMFKPLPVACFVRNAAPAWTVGF